eukprot:jgi/Botrbrau1/8914/Bobra.0148s0028.1
MPVARDQSQDPLANHPKYEKVRDINAGAFGFVQLARNKFTHQQVAIKFLPRGSAINKHVAREIVNHSNFCHPHVIQFKEVFLTDDYLAIAMEYAPGGDLFQYVRDHGGLKEEDARWFFQQLIVGLDYCHRMGVVNRDIKLENTLLDSSHIPPLVKITDFGYCKSDKESLPKSKVGTPGYTAPEVISASGRYDGQKADVWSCGVMLYVMLFCAYPFERDEDDADRNGFRKVLERILRVDYHFPKDPKVSKEAEDLIRKILVADPDKRLSVEQIQAHPWYRKGLPANVQRMNEECLRIKPHNHRGYQTIQDIMGIVERANRTEAQIQATHIGEDQVSSMVDDMLADNDDENDEDLEHFYRT